MQLMYFVCAFFYIIFIGTMWLIRIADWVTRGYKFREIFKVYDLGMIIFPISIPIVLIIFAVCMFSEMIENPKKFKVSIFLNKPLFKDKDKVVK